MLTGLRPFRGDDPQSLAEAIFNREPDLVATSHPDVPAGIDRVLRRALAKQVEDRYPSMGAFSRAHLTALLRRSEPSRAGSRFDAPIALRSSDAAGVTGASTRAAVAVTMVPEHGVLVESLPPVDAESASSPHRYARPRCRYRVRRHGGHVNPGHRRGKSSTVFGVVAAHDDDELRAVRAARRGAARPRASTGAGGRIWIRGTAHPVRPSRQIHVVAQRLPEGPRRYRLPSLGRRAIWRRGWRRAPAAPGEVVLSPECQRVAFNPSSTRHCLRRRRPPEPGAPGRHAASGSPGRRVSRRRLEASEQLGLTPYVGRAGDLALLERCGVGRRATQGAPAA